MIFGRKLAAEEIFCHLRIAVFQPILAGWDCSCRESDFSHAGITSELSFVEALHGVLYIFDNRMSYNTFAREVRLVQHRQRMRHSRVRSFSC